MLNLSQLRNLNIRDLTNIRDLPIIVWVVMGLSVLLIFALIQLAFRLQLPSIPEVLVSPAKTSAQPLPLEKLANLHLFGQNITGQDLSNLPKTTLPLELKGIYSAVATDQGSAIIAVPGQEDHVYLVGDTLPGGAVLLDVYEDRVILRRAGKLEVLMLPQRKLEVKK